MFDNEVIALLFGLLVVILAFVILVQLEEERFVCGLGEP